MRNLRLRDTSRAQLDASPVRDPGPAPRLAFHRGELGGAFGDIGTDFPLIAGMILAGGLDAASVLIVFGLMQVLSGVRYGIPVPAQPLKAVAVIVIAGHVAPAVLYGGGLAIGIFMLLLAAAGLIERLDRVLPKAVIRGIQFGLGLTLARLSVGTYMLSAGVAGGALALAALLIILALRRNRRLPAAIPVIVIGILYGLATNPSARSLGAAAGFALPELHAPTPEAMLQGFLLLGLAQIPLSLGNSIFATRQLIRDLYPDRSVRATSIAYSYAAMNLISPFLSGIPVCHGSGGLAGHHAFGARTGGSVVLYGVLYLVLGLFFSAGFDVAVHLFPVPILGAILLVEAWALIRLIRDQMGDRFELGVAALVGLSAVVLPYGFLVGLVAGTALWHTRRALTPPVR